MPSARTYFSRSSRELERNSACRAALDSRAPCAAPVPKLARRPTARPAKLLFGRTHHFASWLLRMTVLYLTYDGILEPLGQSQVLRYLERLTAHYRIILVSFEKPDDWRQVGRREAMRSKIRATGIIWIALRYHKWPSALATAYDIVLGLTVGIWLVVRHGVRIVHARSYVPSVMAIALKRLFRLKFIFDMRGFWADERVDGGLWPPGGRLWRLAKRFEKRFLLRADCVVSLTQSAIDEMRSFEYLSGRTQYFELITTCADLDTFTLGARHSAKVSTNHPFTLGYVGSVGVWYLFDESLRCFKWLRERVPGSRLHILNLGDHAYILARLKSLDIPLSSVQLDATDHVGVARAMQQMDAGIFLIKPSYSKIGSAPTRLAEFLGCGVPCMGNAGVGDMAAILEGEKVGVILRSFDESAMRAGIDSLVQLSGVAGIHPRCRDVARRHFSLDDGVRRYRAIYDHLS